MEPKEHLAMRTMDGGWHSYPVCHANNRKRMHTNASGHPPKKFRAFPPELRCKLCEKIYLTKRNNIRRQKGLPPVKTPFEGLIKNKEDVHE